jgi:Superfamily II DNA and RNA helicases
MYNNKGKSNPTDFNNKSDDFTESDNFSKSNSVDRRNNYYNGYQNKYSSGHKNNYHDNYQDNYQDNYKDNYQNNYQNKYRNNYYKNNYNRFDKNYRKYNKFNDEIQNKYYDKYQTKNKYQSNYQENDKPVQKEDNNLTKNTGNEHKEESTKNNQVKQQKSFAEISEEKKKKPLTSLKSLNYENNWESIMNKIESVDFKGKKIGKQPNKICESFEDMNLKENLLRGIYAYGFDKPSKIQQESIPIIISGRDIIAQSQSGTGKTGAFTCGLLQQIDETKNFPQGIILSHTRELSTQISFVIRQLSKYMNIETVLCTGGVNIEENLNKIKTSQVIIGTPGRINDMIVRKTFDSKRIKIFCIDEADALLRREFIDQTHKIVKSLHSKTQICIFSATLSDEALEITKNFVVDPVRILVHSDKLTLDLIHQFYIDVGQDKYKLDTLDDLYNNLSIGQCIIYVNTIERANWLKNKLAERDHVVETIHSGLLPIDRANIMNQFRSGIYRVLISTDLLSRGIDVEQVGYVINYELTNDLDCYLHRIGRSGRYGKKGVAINFVTNRDKYIIKDLMEKYNVDIKEMPQAQYLNEYLKS